MSYGDVFLQAEREFSAFNFEQATTEKLLRHFADAEEECNKLLGLGESGANRAPLALPAYDQCMKASHLFNLLDARGVISVTERQAYIGRVRALAKGCCEAWLASQGQGPRLDHARAPARAVLRGDPGADAGARAPRT